MRPRSITALLVLTATVVGCGGERTTEPDSQSSGTVEFTLTRSTQSDVPSDASSAFVRIWNPDTGFNLPKGVDIPDPGTSTKVDFSVPAGSGYFAGVIPKKSGSPPVALAAGKSGPFSVTADATTQVQVDVSPWDISLTKAPESVTPGDTVTLQADISGAPVEGFLAPRFSATLCWDTNSDVGPCAVATSPAGDLNGSQAEINFNVPDISNADRFYFYFVFGVNGRDAWQESGNVAAKVNLPETTLGDTVFSLPVESGSGDVEITFDKRDN